MCVYVEVQEIVFRGVFGGSDVKISKFLGADKIWVRAGVGGHGAGRDGGCLSW